MANAPTLIDVAIDFSPTPGGRLRKHGPSSGEEFRTKVLVPALKVAISHGSQLVVRLDGTAGYAGSFLEEAFGGLVRTEGFSLGELKKSLHLQADASRYRAFVDLANRYMEAAAAKQR